VQNPESAAQVVTALSALGIDPFSDARFIKGNNTLFDAIMAYQLDDGGFEHTLGGGYNPNANSCPLRFLSFRLRSVFRLYFVLPGLTVNSANFQTVSDYYSSENEEGYTQYVTLSISCESIAEQSGDERIPDGGVILPETEIGINYRRCCLCCS